MCQLEKADPNSVHLIENEIREHIEDMSIRTERLDVLARKELPSQKQKAKLRVQQLQYDVMHLRAALEACQQRREQRELREREREELLKKPFSTNDADTAIAMDEALQVNTSLHNVHHGLDELLGSGRGILDGLRDQRQTLKGARTKLLDLANTLGLSNTVMRLVERRGGQDRVIVVVGMIVTCIVMVLVVKYLT
uniref:Golgi SNAP receptor complex member 2 n=1 Tax=Eptatretus burgeri TaxID=7764 RepID=A0A8C4PZA5_EPTBU